MGQHSCERGFSLGDFAGLPLASGGIQYITYKINEMETLVVLYVVWY